MVFESLLDPIFSPILNLSPWLGIAIISLFISLIITIIYKYVTDQNLMKQLKSEMKEFQKEIKELKDNPEQAMKVQKKAMETNMKYMMHSLKPTLFTILPIIIIFGWLNAHMAYYPLLPGQEFTATVSFEEDAEGNIKLRTEGLEILGASSKEIEDSKVIFTLQGEGEGEYLLEFEKEKETYTKEVLLSGERGEYADVEKIINENEIESIKLSNEPIKPFGGFSLFGWKPGWLGAYIIFSILFSSILRKVLKIY